MLWRGRDTENNTAGMCGECSWWMYHIGFATSQGSLYFLGPHCSGSRLLSKGTVSCGPCISCTSQVKVTQVLGCSAGAQIQMGCVFCAFPRSNLLWQPGAWQTHCPRWTVHLIHLPSPGHLVSQVHCKSTVPGVLCISSGELISDCDTPGRYKPSGIPGRHG